MINPIVTVDLTNHPLYSTTDYYLWLAKKWKAEILMLNCNKNTMRVRLYDVDTNEIKAKNFDVDTSYIVDQSIIIEV